LQQLGEARVIIKVQGIKVRLKGRLKLGWMVEGGDGNVSFSGVGVYFSCSKPDCLFRRHETEEGLNVSALEDGVYCLLCRSLQEVPSQGRGLAFMLMDSQQTWRLCVLMKFDLDDDIITYVDLSQEGKDGLAEMPKQLRRFDLSSHLSRGSIVLVNLHFHNVPWTFKVDHPAAICGGYLENRISPTRIFAMNDAQHFKMPKKLRLLQKRNRVDHTKWTQRPSSKSVITIFCSKESRTAMDSITKKLEHSEEKYLLVSSPIAKDPKWIVNHRFSVRERKHYLVPAQCLRALNKRSREEVSSVLESLLERYEDSVAVNLMDVFSARPVRFCIVEQQEFHSLQQQKKFTRFEACGNRYLLSYNKDPDCCLPGKLFLTFLR